MLFCLLGFLFFPPRPLLPSSSLSSSRLYFLNISANEDNSLLTTCLAFWTSRIQARPWARPMHAALGRVPLSKNSSCLRLWRVARSAAAAALRRRWPRWRTRKKETTQACWLQDELLWNLLDHKRLRNPMKKHKDLSCRNHNMFVDCTTHPSISLIDTNMQVKNPTRLPAGTPGNFLGKRAGRELKRTCYHLNFLKFAHPNKNDLKPGRLSRDVARGDGALTGAPSMAFQKGHLAPISRTLCKKWLCEQTRPWCTRGAPKTEWGRKRCSKHSLRQPIFFNHPNVRSQPTHWIHWKTSLVHKFLGAIILKTSQFSWFLAVENGCI